MYALKTTPAIAKGALAGTECMGRFQLATHRLAYYRNIRVGGFFIHGGGEFGSAGCIDVARKDKALQEFTAGLNKSNGCCCYINVDVRYSQKRVHKDDCRGFPLTT